MISCLVNKTRLGSTDSCWLQEVDTAMSVRGLTDPVLGLGQQPVTDVAPVPVWSQLAGVCTQIRPQTPCEASLHFCLSQKYSSDYEDCVHLLSGLLWRMELGHLIGSALRCVRSQWNSSLRRLADKALVPAESSVWSLVYQVHHQWRYQHLLVNTLVPVKCVCYNMTCSLALRVVMKS